MLLRLVVRSGVRGGSSLLGTAEPSCWTTWLSPLSWWQNFMLRFLKLCAQVVSPCWQPSLVAMAALEKELFEMLEAVVAKYFVLAFVGVPLVLWLLAGCRVGVAARAPPLQ